MHRLDSQRERIIALHGRFQEGERHAPEVCPESNGLRDIDAGTQSARCDDRPACRPHLMKAHHRRYAPREERIPEIGEFGAARPQAFDLRPRRAPVAADINGACSGAPDDPCGSGRYAGTRLLHDDGIGELPAEVSQRFDAPLCVVIALRLNRFLERIDVDGDRLCIDHLDSPFRPLDAVVTELDDPQVRAEERVWRLLSHDGETSLQFGLLQCRSLRTDTHAEVVPLGSPCEPPVHLEGIRMSSGHRCNEEGGTERSIEEPCPHLDSIHIALGKGVVNQAHVPESSITGLDGLFAAYLQVFPFS